MEDFDSFQMELYVSWWKVGFRYAQSRMWAWQVFALSCPSAGIGSIRIEEDQARLRYARHTFKLKVLLNKISSA